MENLPDVCFDSFASVADFCGFQVHFYFVILAYITLVPNELQGGEGFPLQFLRL